MNGQSKMARWLVTIAILLLVLLGFYSGVFHVREAGGSVMAVAAR